MYFFFSLKNINKKSDRQQPLHTFFRQTSLLIEELSINNFCGTKGLKSINFCSPTKIIYRKLYYQRHSSKKYV